MQRATRAWFSDSWGTMQDAPAAAIDDAIGVLEDLYGAVGGFRDARRRLLDATHVGDGTRLLELGCGSMPQLADPASRVGRDGRIGGVDYTERFLEVARERARALRID